MSLHPYHLNEDEVRQLLKFKADGCTQEEMAHAFGISRWEVRRILMEAKGAEAVQQAASVPLDESAVVDYIAHLCPQDRIDIFLKASRQYLLDHPNEHENKTHVPHPEAV